MTDARPEAAIAEPPTPCAPIDAAVFERLVREHYRLVVSIARQVLSDAADAEDAAQEAFLKAFRSRDQVRSQEAVVGWLARIARNCALDYGRGRTRQTRLKTSSVERAKVEGGGVDAGQPAMHDDERARLRAAVAELPEAEGLVVTLRFVEGLEPAAIAERLGEKATTVRVRLHRALKRLRGGLVGDESA